MFQMTFAIITPALIVGAFVERIKFSAVLMFSGLWLIVVYAPVAHWVWGGGWLAQRGVLDFAGGIVVHMTAGVSALIDRLACSGRARVFPTRCGRRTRRGSSWSARRCCGSAGSASTPAARSPPARGREWRCW